jgi:hypothetical protein
MAAPTLTQVATAIEARLKTITGLNAYKLPPAVPILDAAIVIPPSINYTMTMKRGVMGLPFKVQLLVSAAGGHDGQEGLWPYLDWAGPKSLMLLFDADPTLGITGADGTPRVDIKVLESSEPELVQVETYQAFGAIVDLLAAVTNKE